ncbi:MAG TPA: NAD(P)-dependent oxidoreductase [Giesbergeria sp.]|jgi:3-hydroxyisobutyrate dehydrogenase-like beta-hydroxyacid dehydrogenase|uniref:NAD(P)-dependent oxidoreductase n=1 Tax=Comamonadaceae TaxID=80864 RepID=UPI001389F3B2|nr:MULTISPECIES: NAD(P)-dependent oxidoreductase [unclassified Acidovorax]MBL8364390.1 NAD(P)-dependent oxidoreductase [Comamonas sp.]MCL4771630.1 NAD(P)-dependent oxidoreductase [Burkholderiaceae bacterium]HNK07187.1 NAD(P)-dependent oxidoreductase [Giesbergeria sp.]NCU66668.1 NAD(P)-dependent oxidoreductase [Acidovorax sp. 210-6]HNQ08991.1 NAD(P)-dependent oxidoreductase [Giesbergeria sp.]
MKVAVLGIGLMGYRMTQRLLEAGHEVHVWNRTHERALPLADLGATVHASAPQAAAAAECVITMLENGPVVGEVLFDLGTAQAMAAGTLVIDMSSIRPSEARDHAARLGERGVAHLDAPVSGGTVGAEQGTLAIMAGGRLQDYQRALPLFSALGRPTHVGPHGAGQMAKLANQMIVGITIGAVAEALLFAAKGGADMAKVREAIQGGFADSRILQLHGQRMVERDFTPHGRLSVQLKDMRNALATAQEIGFDAPITQLFEALYAAGDEHGLGGLDHSGLFVELASRNAMQ